MIAGLSCEDVLGRLSAYIDGELRADDRARVEAHLASCRACDRFGGDLTATLEALRDHLRARAPVPDALLARLRESLARR